MARIEGQKMGAYYPMEHTRFTQLVEVVKRARTQEMGRLKFAANFGVDLAAIHAVKTQVCIVYKTYYNMDLILFLSNIYLINININPI